MNKLANRIPRQKVCKIARRVDEEPVQDGLAVSPATMYDMTKKGIPISTQNQPDNVFDDGDTKNSFFIPVDRKRGVDIVSLWETEQTIKKKARKARKDDIAKYGQYNPNDGKE